MSIPALDVDHLRSATGGDVQVEVDVLRLFIDHARRVLGRLEAAGDDKSWKDAAHSLKGSARGIGAWRVAALCERAEGLTGADERKVVLADLRAAMAATRRAIERRLRTTSHGVGSPCRSCAPRG